MGPIALPHIGLRENRQERQPPREAAYRKQRQEAIQHDSAPWWSLDQAADLARDFPGTTIVINHTGLPADRSAEGLAGWRHAMDGVARWPNVVVNISGLGQRDRPWTQAANVPIIRDTVAAFGVDRCMFASDFPVHSPVASYEVILAGFLAAVADRPGVDRRKLLHDNAVRAYRL